MGHQKSCEFKAAPQCHPSKEGLIMGLLKGSLWLIINLRMPYFTEGRCALRCLWKKHNALWWRIFKSIMAVSIDFFPFT